MFPISDSHKPNTFPFINYAIIAINVVVFWLELSSFDIERFIYQYAFIPAEFSLLELSSYRGMITSVWLHGGFVHLISNMWFLHIFGDNVEDRLGHVRYLLFYLFAGVAATILQYFVGASSDIPMIGASGAISGVAGAYFVFFRNSKIKTLIVAFYFWNIIKLPSYIFLGYWFVIQLFSGVGSLASVDINQGGVAWFAHIGGFVFGYLLARTLSRHRSTSLAT